MAHFRVQAAVGNVSSLRSSALAFRVTQTYSVPCQLGPTYPFSLALSRQCRCLFLTLPGVGGRQQHGLGVNTTSCSFPQWGLTGQVLTIFWEIHGILQFLPWDVAEENPSQVVFRSQAVLAEIGGWWQVSQCGCALDPRRCPGLRTADLTGQGSDLTLGISLVDQKLLYLVLCSLVLCFLSPQKGTF